MVFLNAAGPPGRLTYANAIVTGAASSLGMATARLLHHEEWNVLTLDRVETDIETGGELLHTVPVDVTRLCRGKDVTGQPIHYDNSADHSHTRTVIAAYWHPDSRVTKCIARAGTLDNGLLGHLPRDNNPSH